MKLQVIHVLFDFFGDQLEYALPFFTRHRFVFHQGLKQDVNRSLEFSDDDDVENVEYDGQSDAKQHDQVKEGTLEYRQGRLVNQKEGNVVSNPEVYDVQQDRKYEDCDDQQGVEGFGEQE